MAHPIYDNFVLISSDHLIRLLNLHGETIVKTYNARQVEDGTRLKALFSPCGNYIYAGPCDSRPGVVSKSNGDQVSNLIWKVQTGKLEGHDMAAMDENGAFEHKGDIIQRSPSATCLWYF
jgi:WD40 repeat protein